MIAISAGKIVVKMYSRGLDGAPCATPPSSCALSSKPPLTADHRPAHEKDRDLDHTGTAETNNAQLANIKNTFSNCSDFFLSFLSFKNPT